MDEIRLFRKHVSGQVGWWSVRKAYPNIKYEYCVTSNGAVVENEELVEVNQSGRSWDQQAELMMKSRATRKAQRGYKSTVEEAMNAAFNTSSDGQMLPMLAVRIEKSNPPKYLARWLQPKLNGHRCGIIKTSDGEMIARSRLGNRITTIDPLLDALKPSMPDDLMVDGELYVHGWKLQTIGSAVKKLSEKTEHLSFQTYDVGDIEMHYGERLEELKKIIRPAWERSSAKINIVQTTPITDMAMAWDLFRKYKADTFEGAMLRLDGFGYQPGIRSHGLLKLKSQTDGEFKIIDVKLSDRGMPVCTLCTDAGKRFDCTAPGTAEEKMDLYVRRLEFIGKYMTCEFAELTEDGLPFHCVALQVREDI